MNYIDTDNVKEFCQGGFTFPKEVKQETSDKCFYQLYPCMFDECQILIQKRGYGKEYFEKVLKEKNEGERKMKIWYFKYYDKMGYEVAIIIHAKTRQSALNKFRNQFGYFTLIEIKEIKQ